MATPIRTSLSVPIRPGLVAASSTPYYARPANRPVSPYVGQPITDITFGMNPWDVGLQYPGLHGMGGCGCSPVSGCKCSPGLQRLGQSSLDQIINNVFQWFSGWTQAQLPPSAAVPPQYGSSGAALTQVSQWIPYIIGGLIVWKLVK